MIIVKTPLRISFAGGGSDLPQFYSRSMGATISTTINKYVYVCVKGNFSDVIRLSYSKTEIVDHVDELEHEIVKAALRKLSLSKGLEIVTMADIPSKGTGLGSSSSFTVALLQGLYAYKGMLVSQEDLASQACQIEIDILGKPIGKQDQYIASYGGLRFMEYLPNGVKVNYVIAKPDFINSLEQRFLMFYTGITRDANNILEDQAKGLDEQIKFNNTKKMVELAYEMKKVIEAGDLTAFGNLLHQGWMLKKTLSHGISNNEIDVMYDLAMKNGAQGGKLLGAGGGGFLLVMAEPGKQNDIIKALNNYKLEKLKFDNEGSKILFINKNI